MKTNTSPPPHYSASPLKPIETDPKAKATLRVLKSEDASKNQHFPLIANSSTYDPEAWDAS